MGETHFFRGELTSARDHLSKALTYYTPSVNSLTPITATDLGVVCHVWLAWTEERLGHPRAGEAHVRAALALAHQLQQPLSLSFALTLGAYGFYWLRDDPEAAAAYEEELAPLMEQEALAGMHPWGLVFQGWVLAEQGALADGIRRMKAGLDAWQAMEAVSGRTCQVIPLIRAYIRDGQIATARALVAETLTLMEKTGECLFEHDLVALAEQLDAEAVAS